MRHPTRQTGARMTLAQFSPH